MKKLTHFWLTNAESMIKHPEYGPSLHADFGKEPSSYFAEQGYILLCSKEVDLPDLDLGALRNKTIAALQLHLKDIQLKASMAEREVTKRINDLLMIGYSEGATQADHDDNTIDEVVNRVVDLEVVREVDDNDDGIPF